MMTPDQERIERLEKALLELVYYEKDSNESGWHTEFYVDVYVNDIIGDLLDKYKPKDSDP